MYEVEQERKLLEEIAATLLEIHKSMAALREELRDAREVVSRSSNR